MSGHTVHEYSIGSRKAVNDILVYLQAQRPSIVTSLPVPLRAKCVDVKSTDCCVPERSEVLLIVMPEMGFF